MSHFSSFFSWGITLDFYLFRWGIRLDFDNKGRILPGVLNGADHFQLSITNYHAKRKVWGMGDD